MSECLDLISFADGELEPARAEAFRVHLCTCEACRADLVEVMQLSAQLSMLPSLPRAAAPVPTTHRWVRPVLYAAMVIAPVAIARDLFIPHARLPQLAFTESTTRPFESRFAYPGAAGYRPVTEARLGGAAAAEDGARVSLAAQNAMEARGDRHGLTIARAWNHEQPERVIATLGELPQTPAIRNDRAALEIATTSNDNLETALSELEALRASPDPAAARAARWNYALALAHLDLPLSAAQAFRAIADEHEPGWSQEAAARADVLARRGEAFRARWKRADAAGKQLADGGPPPAAGVIRDAPGVVRAYFYQAVQTATSRGRVEALAPVAAELDRLGDPGQRTLSDYVQRVATRDFRRRAPLATAYADLLNGRKVSRPLLTALTSETSSSDIADIVMGAMVENDLITAHGAWFDAMASRSGDRWFSVVSAREQAAGDLRAGRWPAAEKRLHDIASLCSPALSYQCVVAERMLGKLYAAQHRVRDSLNVLRKALGEARATGEWQRYRMLLWQVADIERLHSATAMVRAYANEHLLTEPGCEDQQRTYKTLAGAALLDVDGRAARGYLEAVLQCATPDLYTANDLADVARLDPRSDDLAVLQAMLGTLRAGGALTPAEHALADEVEGRLVIEHDRAAGRVLLRNAIAAAEAKPGDVLAGKARAGAYAVLAFDAGRAGDYPQVLRWIAQDLALPAPAACAVGMAAEDERAVVVVRGDDGADRGVYYRDRDRSATPLQVSAQLAEGLTRCPRVQVMAPAALQGQPRVLPRELAWSYVAGGRRQPLTDASVSPTAHPLIVTNVSPPASLKLAPLVGSPAASGVATLLSGAEATPSRVLAAMPDASEIVFHTHALMDVGVSDASHLVLSRENDGQYALTAEAIRGIALQGHPVVALTACHSARGARYAHAPWSLPDAFLAVGARAVFATTAEIPDTASGKLFDRLLARVRGGIDPAVALRDERLAAEPGAGWVDDVVLFE